MSKRKLLLADDSITIQKVVNLTFADEGIEVIAVGDGDSAMRKFDEFIPDLVMADINMPGLNGYEICRLIKRTDETNKIPVILLVGSFEPFSEEEAEEAGADAFLTKPFQSIRQLVNKVTDLLNQKERVSFAAQKESENIEQSRNEFPQYRPVPEAPKTESFNTIKNDEWFAPERDNHAEIPDEPQIAPTVDRFADTLELEEKTEDLNNFGDAGLDDEMIETTSVNNFAAEPNYQPETDYGKTQQITAEDFKSFEIPSENYTAPAENVENYPHSDTDTPIQDEVSETETYNKAISETESETDSASTDEKPSEDVEFEKELTDAETLEPEITYTPEEPREADFSEAAPEDSADAEREDELPETTDFAEPQNPELEDFSDIQTQIDEKTEDIHQFENSEKSEEVYADPTENLKSEPEFETSSKFQESDTAELPSLGFDDGDLLELPPLVEETGIRPQPQVQSVVTQPVETVAEIVQEPESRITLTKTVAESEIAVTFPPELIEAIAQKVAEKISAQSINQLMPQLADLIVKKLTEGRKE